MNIINSIKQKTNNIINTFLQVSLLIKLVIVAVVVSLFFGGKFVLSKLQTKKVSYTTEKAAKGTLTTTVTGTGTISSGNSTNITTASTGTVTKVYVINGQKVKKGDKIADIELDEYGLQQQAYYYAKYVDAVHALKTAQSAKDGYDIAMWQARQAILDAEEAVKVKDLDPINPDTKKEWTLSERTIVDKKLEKARLDYDAAEYQYKNADAQIANASNSIIAAKKNYELVSSTIYAPATGTVNNLSLAKGTVISSSSTTITTSVASNSSTSITSQTLGKIYDLDAQMQASVSLSESDIINIKSGQKATLMLDAYPDKTFTGKVLAVDTSGVVSSGVTTYPVTILLDKTDTSIYPNMSASISIITNIKSNVLLIPSGSIDTENEQSVVHILKDGKVTKKIVVTGSSDDSQTEITSGLSEGDEVITNYISANDPSQNNTSSVFSSTSKTRTSSTSSKSTRSSGFGGMGVMGGPPGM